MYFWATIVGIVFLGKTRRGCSPISTPFSRPTATPEAVTASIKKTVADLGILCTFTFTMLPLKFFKISFPAPFVAHLEINRPEKLNAFLDPMWGELKVAFEWLSENPDVRCVMFSGSGEKAFTAGQWPFSLSRSFACHSVLRSILLSVSRSHRLSPAPSQFIPWTSAKTLVGKGVPMTSASVL